MDEQDSHCPYLLSSKTTAKGTGLAESAGKEDPFELDLSLTLWKDIWLKATTKKIAVIIYYLLPWKDSTYDKKAEMGLSINVGLMWSPSASLPSVLSSFVASML